MDWVIYLLLAIIVVGILGLFYVVMKNSSRLSEKEEMQHQIEYLQSRIIERTDNDLELELVTRQLQIEREENSKLQGEVYRLRLEAQRAMDTASGIAQKK